MIQLASQAPARVATRDDDLPSPIQAIKATGTAAGAFGWALNYCAGKPCVADCLPQNYDVLTVTAGRHS